MSKVVNGLCGTVKSSSMTVQKRLNLHRLSSRLLTVVDSSVYYRPLLVVDSETTKMAIINQFLTSTFDENGWINHLFTFSPARFGDGKNGSAAGDLAQWRSQRPVALKSASKTWKEKQKSTAIRRVIWTLMSLMVNEHLKS